MTWPFDNRIADCAPADPPEIPEYTREERAEWFRNALAETVCPFSMGGTEAKPCVGDKCMLSDFWRRRTNAPSSQTAT